MFRSVLQPCNDDPTGCQIIPSPGVVDFDGIRSSQAIFNAAKITGICIVLVPGKLSFSHSLRCNRLSLAFPGPYSNARTMAGGIAHRVISEISESGQYNILAEVSDR